MTPLGIVGASARAAAMSAVRAGFAPWAIDLFADRDLRRIAPVVRCSIDDYPAALPRLVDAMPPGPVLYTGGLENHPDVVREIAARRGLWGNSDFLLLDIRDPTRFQKALARCAFASPDLVPANEPCPASGRWLRKRIRSSGGLGVRFAEPGEQPSPAHYFQQYIGGVPMSAQFVTDPTEPDWQSRSCLIGFTEQLVGEGWLHADEFAYCGNIGPVELPDMLRASVCLLSLRLPERTPLRGLWGLDFIFAYKAAYPIELNPRYTAAVEVLELGSRFSALLSHSDCFTAPRPLWKMKSPIRQSVVGKAIYYAPHAFTFPAGPWDDELVRPFDPWRVPDFADIPDAGSAIEPGQPVLTVFATGNSPAAVRAALQSRAAELDDLFG